MCGFTFVLAMTIFLISILFFLRVGGAMEHLELPFFTDPDMRDRFLTKFRWSKIGSKGT